jgi:transcriptional regulator with XRE-family HTH domain
MAIRDVSQRRLATIAGYKSHAYLGRLCRGDVSTLDPDAALRIAHWFGVPVNDLFMTRTSSDAGHAVKHRVA